MSDKKSLSYQRRCAVEKAWARERAEVHQKHGSRDWTKREQKEILSTGKCNGYIGQHMLSVKENPAYAGEEDNIQFLTPKEHYQAHHGNWKNDAHGMYNPQSGKIRTFQNGPERVPYTRLSHPLNEREIKFQDKKYQKILEQKKKAQLQYNRSYHERKNLHRKILPVTKTDYTQKKTMDAKRNFFNQKADSSRQTVSARRGKADTTAFTTGQSKGASLSTGHSFATTSANGNSVSSSATLGSSGGHGNSPGH